MGNGEAGRPQVPAPTAAQMHQAGSRYHLRSYSDGGAGLLRMLRDLFGNDPNAVDALDPAIMRGLRRGLYKRSAPAAPTAFYPGISHPQLYASVTRSVDPGQLGEIAAAWSNSSEKLLDASQSNAVKALAVSEMTWQGKAGEAARASVAKLANAAGQLGQASQMSAQLYEQQSAALSHAKNSIPKPPTQPFDAVSAAQRLATVTDPVRFMVLAQQDQAQFVAQQQAHQQAADIVRQYDQVVTQTSRNQPAFAPAPQVTKRASQSTSPSGTTPSRTGSPQRSATGQRVEAGSGGGVASSHQGASVVPHAHAGSTNAGHIGSRSGTVPTRTSTSAFVPSDMSPTSPGGQGPSGGLSNIGAPDGGPSTGGTPPVSGGAGLGGPGRNGDHLGPGVGPGVGRDANNRGAQSGAGQRNGAGAPTEEEAVERAAQRGTGSGMVPATRGSKGGEDDEHKRPSYLTEPDPNDIFGVDEKTAPPVIG